MWNDDSQSAEFSFLLSLPIILGGFIFELIKIDDFSGVFEMISPLMCVFAFVFTFLYQLFL